MSSSTDIPDDGRPPRPDPLVVKSDAVPETLRQRPTWVCWRYQFDSDRDEWTKIPVDPTTGRNAKSNDSETWATFEDAVDYHERSGTNTDGIGYVVHDGDTVAGVDLDDCRDPETGDLEAWGRTAVDAVPTYWEVSPSGTGLRAFGLGFVPDGGTRADINDAEGHIEMYDSGRYLTVTGHTLEETPDTVEQVNDEIADVHAEHIADSGPDMETPKPAGDGGVRTRTGGPTPGDDPEKQGSSDLSDD